MKKVIAFISGVLMLIGMVLFFVLPGWYTAGAIFFGFTIIVSAVTSLKKRHETKCSKCKKKYDYDTDVAWRLVSKKVSGSSAANGSRVIRSFFTYDITCQCSDCGKVKKYRKKIEGPSINDKHELNSVNPEYVLEENFGEKPEPTVGTIFMCLIMAVAFTFGGLLASGGLENMDISVPGVTVADKGEDPADYYGTYYCIEDSSLITIIVDAQRCTMIEFNGVETVTESYEYEYASAEYVAQRFPGAVNKTDSLLLYASSDKSKAIVLAVEKTGEEYQIRTNGGAVATTTILTMADVTNDPKDYYGTYMFQSFYVVLNSDGSATMDLGEGAEQYMYMYADAAYLSTWYGKSYGAGIILTQKDVDGAVIFNYKNGELILQDTYTFTK